MRHKEDDTRDCLRASDPVDVVWPLSLAVLRLLEETSEIADPLPSGLSQRLLGVLRTSEVLWESPLPNNMMVFKCPADVVVKAVRHVDDDTEYTTLQYLELHSPAIPAPRPLGYVRMSGITLIFQTYKPSTTLATVWPQLDSGQKGSIRDQLDAIMSDLRSIIPYTAGSALGAAKTSEDICGSVRSRFGRLANLKNSYSRALTPAVRYLLTYCVNFYPPQSEEMKIVFTHGDLRPENIAVDMDDCNQWVVTGLFD